MGHLTKGGELADLLPAECRLDADLADEVRRDSHADEPAPNQQMTSERLHRPVDTAAPAVLVHGSRSAWLGVVSHLTPVPSDPEQLRAWLAHQGTSPLDAFLGMGNASIDLPAPPPQPRLLTIKVTLEDTKPPVWRRLVVPGDLTLDGLHDVLQTAMGWTDSHLHRFFAGTSPDDNYFVTEYDAEEGDDGTPEAEARLDQVLREPGDCLRYEYDFGDGWDHELRLEDVADLEDDARPRCIGGRLACPPEDVGGVGGYAEVAAWVRAGRPRDDVPPSFESAESATDWLPIDWHPDAFDIEETDLRLQATVASGELLERLRPEARDAALRLSPRGAVIVSGWLAAAAQTSLSTADLDELTEPYRRLLAVIGGGVELTASGYLRPPVVGELCTALGIDPILAGKANRESNVRPLVQFRKVVQQAGLLHTASGVLTPTVAGIRFGDDAQGLWQHMAARLPVGRGELKKEVGWFTLLALAGGLAEREVFDAVHELCVDAGWGDEQRNPIARHHVIGQVHPALAALLGARWNSRRNWPAWVPAAAASVIFAEGLG